MDCDERPKIRALVACFSPVFGVVGHGPVALTDSVPEAHVWPKLIPLEEAVDYMQGGFAVLIDPQDERDLAMHERLERAMAEKPKYHWYER